MGSRDHKLQVISEQDVPDKELRCLLSFPKTSPTAAPGDVMKAEATTWWWLVTITGIQSFLQTFIPVQDGLKETDDDLLIQSWSFHAFI